ncbi:E3 ubiquitin-protein ligase ATL23-like [Malania oleifera]|uniref:E3 ubiquitin-protein ligase ATL23-like n=1 Tax=Malania oleifera TaxID=397392 RepID=UPI0025AE8D54|nr:E3 ubiquitin-protein ligase ATL23-like [Malania oleifera]
MNHGILGVAAQIMVMAIVLSLILLFAGIVMLVLIHVCIVGRAFRRGSGNITMVERVSTGSRSMSRDDIEKLPCFDFEAKQKGSSPVDCAVCLENFKAGEKCRLLPLCKHSFHARCVDSWLLMASICPICRTSAENWKAGLVSAEESSRFSDTLVEVRESQTSESGIVSEAGIELRESQRVQETGHLGEARIELRENQAASS